MTEGRWELKYMVREENIPHLLDVVKPYVVPDENASLLPNGGYGYTVSSLYLDNEQLEGYTERLRMDRIRNRVRVRTYGRPGDRAPVFLEAKRKLDNQVIKHRARAPFDSQEWKELGDRPWQACVEPLTGVNRQRAKRFRDHVDGKKMVPVCTVRYEREIFTSGNDRLTLDRNVRAAVRPPANELYAPSTIRLIPKPWVVLELKFYGQAPEWMRMVTRELHLRAEPVSKFALGVGLGLRADHPLEVKQITPHSVLAA